VAVLGRTTEGLLAGAALVRACRTAGDAAEAERVLGELRAAPMAGAAAFALSELDALEDRA
jgi:hypothetical protein